MISINYESFYFTSDKPDSEIEKKWIAESEARNEISITSADHLHRCPDYYKDRIQ